MALLCVLLMHALAIIPLLATRLDPEDLRAGAGIQNEPVHLPPDDSRPSSAVDDSPGNAPWISVPLVVNAPALPGSADPHAPDTSDVDWPLEGRKAAARVLAREAEAERIAKLFAGPDGTWASLTRRQKSKLDKFRFRPGVAGLEYDSRGNQIYHISDGCVIVNSMFFACALGKPKVRDDMFDGMREYFDEQRLPPTNEGNGTEPEALRPPY